MLSTVNRIKKKKDFEAIFKNSRSFKNNLFVFKAMKNALGINRFGFVVSLKVSKKAVVRNRVRRRLSEIMKEETKNIKNGTDLVLIALPGVEKKEFSELKKSIENAIIKIRGI